MTRQDDNVANAVKEAVGQIVGGDVPMTVERLVNGPVRFTMSKDIVRVVDQAVYESIGIAVHAAIKDLTTP